MNKEKVTMDKCKAYAIFKQIDSDKYTDAEKSMAVCIVARLETYNGITKADMMSVIQYLNERKEK